MTRSLEADVAPPPADPGELSPWTLELELPSRPEWPVKQVYIGDRLRSSTTTSVQFLAEDLMACGSFDGRRLDLVALRGCEELSLLDSIPGTYRGNPVQNDLLAADPTKEFLATSNFHTGSSTLYRHDGSRLYHVRDLSLKVNGFVHGVRFYDQQVIVLTGCNGPTGVHFFDIETGATLLHVGIPRKCQDVAFVSPNRMIAVSVLGAPKFESSPIYDSELQVVDFDLKTGTISTVSTKLFEKAHFDACVICGDSAYITDQYNNEVLVIDVDTLEPQLRIGGYDFPHGLDIAFGKIAVTNYGTSTLRVNSLDACLRNGVAASEQ